MTGCVLGLIRELSAKDIHNYSVFSPVKIAVRVEMLVWYVPVTVFATIHAVLFDLFYSRACSLHIMKQSHCTLPPSSIQRVR